MAKYEKEWARRWRKKILNIFNNKCVDCGATENLEFDCIVPCGDKHHRMDTSARMCFYKKQYQNFNLTVRCTSCNAEKSNKMPF